jgi:predicted aspartyl protease
VGQVHARVTVTNGRDAVMHSEALMPADDVRALSLDSVLVDTGATMLCLPGHIIEALGLRPVREVQVETAQGMTTTRIFGNIVLRIDDREGTFDCLETPGGDMPLLGVVPLEVLGSEPDLKNRQLRKLPMDETRSYLTIL